MIPATEPLYKKLAREVKERDARKRAEAHTATPAPTTGDGSPPPTPSPSPTTLNPTPARTNGDGGAAEARPVEPRADLTPPTQTDDLLFFAAQGVGIFRLAENAKVPERGSQGHKGATTDPEVIRALVQQSPRANWGVAPGPNTNGRHGFILDLDVRRDPATGQETKNGITRFRRWCAERTPPVDFLALTTTGLVVGTGGSGLQVHLDASHVVRQGTNLLGKAGEATGIDTRVQGYGIAPGSQVNGGAYRFVSRGLKHIAPAQLTEALGGAPKEKPATPSIPPVEINADRARARFIELVKSTAPAIEGESGDDRTFTLAKKGKDFGVSESVNLDVLLEYFDPRCVPSWGLDALRVKVRNAYKYGKESPGSAAPEVEFATPLEGTKTPATPNAAVLPFDPHKSRIGDVFTDEPPRPRFIVEGFYPVAAGQENSIGGKGKTTRRLWEAVHLILGRPLFGRNILKAGPVLVVSKEDPLAIFQYRMHHVAAALALSAAERTLLAQHVHVLDLTGDVGGRLVEVDRDGNLHATNLVERICRGYQHEGVVQVIFDPLNAFSPGERFVNDSEASLMVAGARIARELDCNVLFTAHVSKDTGRRGLIDAHSGRGGSAMGDNARFVFSYIQHDLKEETTWKALPSGAELAAAHGNLFRLHMTKQSYAKCMNEPIWIERQGFAFTIHEGAPTTPESILQADGERVLTFLRSERARGLKYSPSALAEEYRQFPLSRGRARVVIDWLQSEKQIIARPLPENERNRKRTHYLDTVDRPVSTVEELFT